MATVYTTTRLLADIKRSAHFPTNQTTFEDSDLLAIADYELQTFILPLMLRIRENYLLKDRSVPISGESYPIPTRAIGGKLADVQLIVGNFIEQLRLIQIGQLDSTIASPVGARAFYIKRNSIILTPVPTYGDLKISYYSRPGKLVGALECGQITDIDTLNSTITVSAVPSTFTTQQLYDLIQNQSGFDTLSEDIQVTNIAGNVLTVSTIPDLLAEGDWISLAGEAPIAQIPVELMPLLTQAVVCEIYEIQGYLSKLERAKAKLDKMSEDLMALVTPRVSEAAKIIGPPQNDVAVTTRFGYNRFRRY